MDRAEAIGVLTIEQASHRKGGLVDRAIDMAIAALREQEQSKWISVEERLPEVEGSYLTYTDKERIHIDSFCIYPKHGTMFWVGGNGTVTHWMPLPEPPEEGADQ